MKKLLFAVLFFIAFNAGAQNQGVSNNWQMGYASWGGLPYGHSNIDFSSSIPSVMYDSLEMDFAHTHANISDTSGNLLFYTNGYYIADASHDTMQNGSGINPGAYANYVPDGFLIPQGALIIKKPGSESLYYLFHCTVDNYPAAWTDGSISFHAYLTAIDMNANGGLGAVVSKNQSLITDSLNTGKIAACRHANGRDWWVMVHRVNSNTFYKFLITPYGNIFYTQTIGSYRMHDAGQAKFSPDGTRFSYYHYFNGLDIFDFDRCTGMLSNAISDATLPYIQGNVGCEFSPNSNVLYVCNIDTIYQYDLTATNVISNRNVVAAYDGFYDQFPGLGTYLCYPQLAPDGKIYIATGNSTRYMHIIDFPDSVGTACNVVQHGLQIPTFSFNTIPNHPNYFLGREFGSPCDTITSWIGAAEHSPDKEVIKVFSNPNDGRFTLWFNVHDAQGGLRVYDVNGNLVLEEGVAQWSQYKQVDITRQPAGVYFVRMSWGGSEGSVKVVKN